MRKKKNNTPINSNLKGLKITTMVKITHEDLRNPMAFSTALLIRKCFLCVELKTTIYYLR